MNKNTQFEVCLYIQIEAENPLEAAKKFRDLMLETTAAQEMAYIVRDIASDEEFTVDFSKDDEDGVSPM